MFASTSLARSLAAVALAVAVLGAQGCVGSVVGGAVGATGKVAGATVGAAGDVAGGAVHAAGGGSDHDR